MPHSSAFLADFRHSFECPHCSFRFPRFYHDALRLNCVQRLFISTRRVLGDWNAFSRQAYVMFGMAWVICGLQTVLIVFSTQAEVNWTCSERASPLIFDALSATHLPCAQAVSNDTYVTTWHPLYTLASHTGPCAALSADLIVFDAPAGQSLIADFSLVCDRASHIEWLDIAYFFGYLLGSGVFGWLCDKHGRKYGFQTAAATVLLTTIVYIKSATFMALVIARVCVGFGCSGLILSSFMLACEFVGPSAQATAGILFSTFFSCGMLLMSAIGDVIIGWQALTLVITLPVVLLVIATRTVPESPRWLHSMQRHTDVDAVLRAMAEYCSVSLDASQRSAGSPYGSADECDDGYAIQRRTSLSKRTAESRSPPVSHATPSLVDLWTDPKWGVLLAICGIIWCLTSLVYYGLSLSAALFPGSLHVNNALCAAVEIPAYLIVSRAITAVSRRTMLLLSLGTACVCIGLAAAAQEMEFASVLACAHDTALCASASRFTVAAITFVIAGKFGCAAATAILYILTVDLFPTVSVAVRCNRLID